MGSSSCSFPHQEDCGNGPADGPGGYKSPEAGRLPATTMARLVTAAALLALLSAGLCEQKVFLQRAGTAFNSRPYTSVLSAANGGTFGDWTWPEMCPETFYAVGFSLRVKAPPGAALADLRGWSST